MLAPRGRVVGAITMTCFSVEACLESGPQGHLGLSEPDVSPQIKPVHGLFRISMSRHYVPLSPPTDPGSRSRENSISNSLNIWSPRGKSGSLPRTFLSAQRSTSSVATSSTALLTLPTGFFSSSRFQAFQIFGSLPAPMLLLNQLELLHRDEYLVPVPCIRTQGSLPGGSRTKVS